VEFLDFGVKLVEGGSKRARQRIVRGEKRGPVRPEDTEIEFGVKERNFESVARRRGYERNLAQCASAASGLQYKLT
jgi:hypothetical protein